MPEQPWHTLLADARNSLRRSMPWAGRILTICGPVLCPITFPHTARCTPDISPMKTITDKMAARGVESLSDAELLAVLTDDEQTAGALLAACGGALARIASEDAARLRMVGGLGLRRARLLLAAAEFGRRVAASRAAEADVIATSDDVVALFRPQLETLAYEECWAVYLTSSNRIIERQRISQGGVQGTVVDHRLVVKRALELLATQLVLIHNHPSGAAAPSPQDKVLTERVAQAAALFDIRLLDHIIIAREGDFSFLRAGLV